MTADHFEKTHATNLSPLFINSVQPKSMQKQKIDKNTNNKIMLFYDSLYTAYKDVWTLLVYTSVPWGQNRTACSLLC